MNKKVNEKIIEINEKLRSLSNEQQQISKEIDKILIKNKQKNPNIDYIELIEISREECIEFIEKLCSVQSYIMSLEIMKNIILEEVSNDN